MAPVLVQAPLSPAQNCPGLFVGLQLFPLLFLTLLPTAVTGKFFKCQSHSPENPPTSPHYTPRSLVWSSPCPPPQAPLLPSSHSAPDLLESKTLHILFLLIGTHFPVLLLADFSSSFRLSLDVTSSNQSFPHPSTHPPRWVRSLLWVSILP